MGFELAACAPDGVGVRFGSATETGLGGKLGRLSLTGRAIIVCGTGGGSVEGKGGGGFTAYRWRAGFGGGWFEPWIVSWGFAYTGDSREN
jgi:hypothetical protein